VRLFINLTPLVPLFLGKERGKVLKRGASAPLRRSTLLAQNRRVTERQSLSSNILPPPLSREGEIRGRVT